MASSELSQYLHTVIQRKCYVRGVLANIKYVLVPMNRELKQLKASLYTTFPPRMSVADKEVRCLEDSTILEKQSEVDEYSRRADYLESLLESLDDVQFSLSRALSARMNENSDTTRDIRVGRG